MATLTQQQLRQRKFFTILPVITYPFIVLLFWAMGGGKAGGPESKGQANAALNTVLPAAANKDNAMGMLSLYELAEKDSARLAELRAQDTKFINSAGYNADTFDNPAASPMELTGKTDHIDPNEVRAQETLQRIQRQLDISTSRQATDDHLNNKTEIFGQNLAAASPTLIGQLSQDQGTSGDSELSTISQMLDKIKEIQHPELVAERVREQSNKQRGKVFPVSASASTHNEVQYMATIYPQVDSCKHFQSGKLLSDLGAPDVSFYGLSEGPSRAEPNSVSAIIYRSAVITNNSMAQLMLTSNMYVNGVLIPKGTFVFGVCQINNERVLITITSIQYQKSFFPVNLLCYGADGQEGVPAPGALKQEAGSQGLDNSLQLMNMGASVDPSIGNQAATAGIEAARSYLSRKVKTVKSAVNAGEPVFLIDKAVIGN